jgi:hypothetical protein
VSNSSQSTGLTVTKLFMIDLHECVQSVSNLRPLVIFFGFCIAVNMWIVVLWVVMPRSLHDVLKVEVIYFSKILVTTYKTTQHHKLEGHSKL